MVNPESNKNLYESPLTTSPVQPPPPRVRFWVVALALTSIVVVLSLLTIPAPRRASGAARRVACVTNLRQLAEALANYEKMHGSLPPAYTVDAEGNRLHSWRTLVLPFIGEQALYATIDLTKPWDDPANATALAAEVSALVCPGSPDEGTKTTYLALIGPSTCFGRSTPTPVGTRQRVIMLADVPYDRGVHWMDPHDIDAEEFLRIDANEPTQHNGVIVVATADKAVHSLPLTGDSLDLGELSVK